MRRPSLCYVISEWRRVRRTACFVVLVYVMPLSSFLVHSKKSGGAGRGMEGTFHRGGPGEGISLGSRLGVLALAALGNHLRNGGSSRGGHDRGGALGSGDPGLERFFTTQQIERGGQ